MSENWLLAYEGVKKGWLTPIEANLLDNNLFFKILKNKSVEFYKQIKQLKTYKPKEDKPIETYSGGQAAEPEQQTSHENQQIETTESTQTGEPFDIFISGFEL
jgi:hypothetical protein